MCDLSDFRNRNHLIRQELFLKSQEEEKLRVEAYEDRLTGCYTRLHAEKTCFPSASNPIAFPCANGIFTATLKERITHYTLQVKSCAKSTPFGPPGQQNRLNIPYFPGAWCSAFICCQPPISRLHIRPGFGHTGKYNAQRRRQNQKCSKGRLPFVSGKVPAVSSRMEPPFDTRCCNKIFYSGAFLWRTMK